MKTSWQFALDPKWNPEFGGGSSQQPVYQQQPATQPDPYTTANAQQGYNVNSAVAQSQLNNTDQVTPYGTIHYTQNGGSWVGAQDADPGTPATGGYWDGQKWVPTGGTPGHAATKGTWVPTYTATTSLSPELQKLVNTGILNAQQASDLQGKLLTNVQQQATHPLDLSWGNIADHIYGLERRTLDPYWKQQQEVKNQELANQGLTAGSQGWGYEQTQLNKNKSDAYTNAMLAAQSQSAQDLTTEYNSPLNWYNALRSGSQVNQPGVGQTADTAKSSVQPANYAGIASSNYATATGANTAAYQAQMQAYQQQQQQQSQLLGGLFSLGGSLLGGLGGLL